MAIPLKKYVAYTPRFIPRVDSPDETGEVARISVPKGGRAVKPAAVAMLPRNDNKKVRHIERSEISHDQSEDSICLVSYSVGFFTTVQNDVKQKSTSYFADAQYDDRG